MSSAEMTEAEFDAAFAKATALSDYFREIGPQADRDNTFTFDSIQAFQDSGLGALNIPKEFGGLDVPATELRPVPPLLR